MTTNNITLLLTFLLFTLNSIYGQDTIRLEKKPKVILHSWYPEFKKFPKLKIGESKILFTIIPEFEKLSIRDNDIDLKTSNSNVKIEETMKTNQYVITINPTDAKDIEFESWFDLENKTILIMQDGKWQNIKELYTISGSRILIDTVKLRLIK